MSEPVLQASAEVAKLPDIMPVLPLKDVVTYPFIILPLSVGREKSVRAVDEALAQHRILMLLTQRSPQQDDPGEDGVRTVVWESDHPVNFFNIVASKIWERREGDGVEIYFAGDRIFSMGDLGDRMYVIDEGEVGISIQSGKVCVQVASAYV